MKNRYRICVAYDGTEYFGWQSQKKLRTIQGTLQSRFKTVFNRSVSILGASRTDAGVHAQGQVASFDTDLICDPQKILYAWNNALPLDIKILDLQAVSALYKPHDHVDKKIYNYHVFLDRPSPFYTRFGYYYPYPIDIERMRQALSLFIGTHDFSSFRSIDDIRENTMRTVFDIQINYVKQYNWYKITIIGNKFLRHMIRRMVGAALDMGAHPKRPIHFLQDIFDACDPCHTLPNAPAQGLMLERIIYER